MKITCQSCQTKYTIADDKVAGKTVKIKCRKCGSAIVVDGSQPQAAEPAHAAQGDGDDAAETRVFAEGAGGAPPPARAGEWLVNVAEGDERSMSAAQIAAEYARGTLTQDTYVWKEGMGDWAPIGGVPELAQAIAAQGRATPPPAAPAVQEPPLGLMGTVVMDSSAPAARPSSPSGAPRPASVPPPAAAAAAAAPAAARRAVNRGGVDVFGAREQAAAAPAVSPSAPPPGGASGIGARNENSVLFSLSALTAAETAAKAQQDQGVLDLRPSPGPGPRPGGPPPPRNNGGRAGLDDIMNLGGGGIGSPMLAPPPVLAPVIEAPPPPPLSVAPPAGGMGMGAMPMMIPETPKKKSPVGLIIGIVAALVVVGGAAAAALGVFSPTPQPVAQNDATTGQTTATEAKPADTAAAEAKPADTGAVAAAQPGGPRPGGPTGSQPGGAKTAEKEPEKTPEKTPEPAPKETAAPAGGGGDLEFNRGAATSALGAAAGSAKSCKKPDGPTGSGKVKVTFAPSGNVTSAQVQGAPFAGTPVGGCVASVFRGARVPPFSGAPVSVTKSFTIN